MIVVESKASGRDGPLRSVFEIRRGKQEHAAGESTGADGVRVLSVAGFLANRQGTTRSLGLASDAPLARIVEMAVVQWGGRAPARLFGTVAAVVRDDRAGRVLAFADRSGSNRIYYSRSGTKFTIGWSVDSVLDKIDDRRLDETAIIAHVCGQPLEPDATLFKEIRAVEPGGMLVVDDRGLSERQYWSLEPQSILRLPTDGDYADAFSSLLNDVVGEYMPSGSVGISLSGGLDSTTVAVAARRRGPDRCLAAVRWTAPDLPEAEEGHISDLVVRRLELEDHSFDGGRHWPLSRSDVPAVDAGSALSNIFTELVDRSFEEARRAGVGCLLTGRGGDQLFGGNVYSYSDLFLRGRWLDLSRQLRIHQRESGFSWWRGIDSLVLRPIVGGLLPRRESRKPPWLAESHEAPRVRRPVSSLELRMAPSRRRRFLAVRHIAMAHFAELMTRRGALFGIDVRSPLEDHRMKEFAVSLPPEQTYRAPFRKVIMRNAMRDELPREIVDEPGKIYPIAIVLRGIRERETAKVWALLTGMRSARMGFLDEQSVRQAYRQFLDGGETDTPFWNVLTLEAWLRRLETQGEGVSFDG